MQPCVHPRSSAVTMDRRLKEACVRGDATALKRLLEDDPLILDIATASSSVLQGPLHMVALRGHVDIIREIIRVRPELALERNADGSYPLHLAAANGHRQAVEELLKADANVSLLRDGRGHLPLHTAVLKGRSDVMEALIHANRESARELTIQGESVLHLAVRSNNFELVRYLVESPDLDEGKGFFNLKDEGGSTALHLATARRQRKAVEFLTSIPGLEVNATNTSGATALDVLLELPCPEEGDLLLGNILSTAGGRATRHGNPVQPGSTHGCSNPPTAPAPTGANPDEWFRYTNTTWVVVALMMGTLAYQAILQPPGGFSQAGKAVLAGDAAFTMFTAFNTGVFFASMSLILLPLCAPSHRRSQFMTTVLLWIMRIAVFCTLLTFSFAAFAIYPDGRTPCFVLVAWVALVFGISVVGSSPVSFDVPYLRRFFPRRIATLAKDRDNLSVQANAEGMSTQSHIKPPASHSIELGFVTSTTQSAPVPQSKSQSDVLGGIHVAQAQGERHSM